jgi:hypothetical protein
MPLICGFRNNPKGTAAFERLNKAEKDFLLTPPGPCLGIPTIMMATALPSITKTSIPIMLARLRMIEPAATESICAFAIQQLNKNDMVSDAWKLVVPYDDAMAELVRLQSGTAPQDHVYQDRILTYWFETRFYGCTANVAYESNREWIKRLRMPTPPPKAEIRMRQELKEFWESPEPK